MSKTKWATLAVILTAAVFSAFTAVSADDDDLFVAKAGSGYNYLTEGAVEELTENHSEDADTPYGKFYDLEDDMSDDEVVELFEELFETTSHKFGVNISDSHGIATRCLNDDHDGPIGTNSFEEETDCFQFSFDRSGNNYYIKTAYPQ